MTDPAGGLLVPFGREGLVSRWGVLWVSCALAGCAKDEPGAVGVSSGACSSFTSKVTGSRTDTTVWYRPDGLEEVRTEEVFVDDLWIGTTTWERGYLGDQLASLTKHVEAADPDDATHGATSLTTYAYDDDGRLVEEQLREDNVLQHTTTYRYDELGHQVESYRTMHGGADDMRSLHFWEEGRLRRTEVWNVPQDRLAVFTDFTFLESAPSLDADVHGFKWGLESFYRLHYDGERVVEQVLLDGPDPLWGYDTFQWVWRDDGQLALLRSLGPGQRRLEAYSYDADGHILTYQRGEDADGDDVIDALESEQTWTRTCP